MKEKITTIVAGFGALLLLSGCYTSGSSFADQLNPFADSSSGELGERNLNALGGGGAGKAAGEARHALEVMTSYQRTQAPQPYYPVIRPADVRLMWIPDHMNRLGDLVPAHYYYLRVTRDEPAVTDAFEIERQLNSRGPSGYSGGGGGGVPVSAPASGAPAGGDTVSPNLYGTATPWQYKEGK